jgi:nitrogen fixation protein NifQ
MDAAEIYAWLTNSDSPAISFDAHVVASVLALSIAETRPRGVALSEATGLTAAETIALATDVLPQALPLLASQESLADVVLPEDERCLRELLSRFTTHGTALERNLAALISRRSLRPNHLWQDLGLRSRAELTELMNRHFWPLARRNANGMKWKKFLYRMICRDEGFRLCTAPSCAECDDFTACFNDESGESLLARNRRDAERQAQTWFQILPV